MGKNTLAYYQTIVAGFFSPSIYYSHVFGKHFKNEWPGVNDYTVFGVFDIDTATLWKVFFAP